MTSVQSRHPIDWVAIIASLIALFGSVWIEATHNDRENTRAIAALQQAKTDTDGKIDHIQTQVDRLVDWFINHDGVR